MYERRMSKTIYICSVAVDDDIIKYIIPKLSGPQEPIDPEPTEGMTIPPLRVTVGPKAPDVRLASSVARSILFTLTSGGCYRTSSYEYCTSTVYSNILSK